MPIYLVLLLFTSTTTVILDSKIDKMKEEIKELKEVKKEEIKK